MIAVRIVTMVSVSKQSHVNCAHHLHTSADVENVVSTKMVQKFASHVLTRATFWINKPRAALVAHSKSLTANLVLVKLNAVIAFKAII